jgi:hypothetical protein
MTSRFPYLAVGLAFSCSTYADGTDPSQVRDGGDDGTVIDAKGGRPGDAADGGRTTTCASLEPWAACADFEPEGGTDTRWQQVLTAPAILRPAAPGRFSAGALRAETLAVPDGGARTGVAWMRSSGHSWNHRIDLDYRVTAVSEDAKASTLLYVLSTSTEYLLVAANRAGEAVSFSLSVYSKPEAGPPVSRSYSLGNSVPLGQWVHIRASVNAEANQVVVALDDKGDIPLVIPPFTKGSSVSVYAGTYQSGSTGLWRVELDNLVIRPLP